ncbi:hypothetical protein [Chitinophaga nivalis]|nr:hypothetical protein [Chitinophaga nivalis]MCW3463682.1 hypothetical protein [Chitinophaga nivalis]
MYNFLIKDQFSDERILECLKAFFIGQNISIASFDHDMDQPEDLLFESILMRGDFCIQLWLYAKLNANVIYRPKEMASHICCFLKTEILISEKSINPFEWILITANGDERIVYQKIEDNDEDVFLLDNKGRR